MISCVSIVASKQKRYATSFECWDSWQSYVIGDHVSVGFVDYWAVNNNTNSQPSADNANWSTNYVAPQLTYATWDAATAGAGISLSNGNLNVTLTSDTENSVRATIGKSSGKWYWEVNFLARFGNFPGVATSSINSSTVAGIDANGWSIYPDRSTKATSWHNGITQDYLMSITWPIVVGYKLNMDVGAGSNQLSAIVGGVDIGVVFSNLPATVYPVDGGVNAGLTTIANFGQSAFSNSVPAGYNSGVYI